MSRFPVSGKPPLNREVSQICDGEAFPKKQGAQTEELPATKALSALAKRQREGERSTSQTVMGCGFISGPGISWGHL